MLKAVKFRVQNFRNIDDSRWIPIERVTALVGRNESGKTALLKALHKFNPATAEPYIAQREFPRDRYTRDFKDGKTLPVCSVAFEIGGETKRKCEAEMGGVPAPEMAVFTRYYDGRLTLEFDPKITTVPVAPNKVLEALDAFAKAVRRIPTPADQTEEQMQTTRGKLAEWATSWQTKFATISDLRSQSALLQTLSTEAGSKSAPITADIIEALLAAVNPALQEAKKEPLFDRLSKIVTAQLPVFIYFENYGILDSAIYLPRFLEDLKGSPTDPRVRTIQAMFKHVSLAPDEITALGSEKAMSAVQAGQAVTPEMIASDQQKKELRSVKLNAASLDISRRFSEWWLQRRHEILYEADGNYFRIWVSDDRRPGVKIELESRSKGFQWFFSFYLIFLVESEDGHKQAILLLDEPGLNLHPTAQQGLITFFEKLADSNQLLYSTHSPFMIDGEHIHRVRPVTEDETGHSNVSVGEWPSDRETIFPLQAAAGYAMLQGLFQHKKNVLVEGMTDYYYLHSLSSMCARAGKATLPDDVYITPCGGTKYVGHIASLFLGQKVQPVVLLDGDDAGRARRDALLRELYSGREKSVLILSDVLGATHCDIEDILGEGVFMDGVRKVIGNDTFTLADADRATGSLPDQVKAAARRQNIQLPDGWKAAVAIHLVSKWAEAARVLPGDILDRASALLSELRKRFEVAA